MSRGRFIALSVVLDAVLVNVGFLLAYLLRFGGHLPEFNFQPYLSLAPILTAAFLGAGYIYGLYEPERTENPWAVVRAVLLSVTVGSLLTFAIAFVAGTHFFSLSRLVIGIAWALQNMLLAGWRMSLLRVTPIRWPQQRVLVIGVGGVAVELATEMRRREGWGYRVVGLLARDEHERISSPGEISGFPVLGTASEAAAVVAAERVDRVIVVSPVALRELVENLALSDEADVRVDVVPELYEVFIGTVDNLIGDIPLMEITRRTVPPWYAATKRVADFVSALALLVVLSPVLLLAALAILVSMGRPVTFSQERVGKDMKPFRVHKFRTMVRDAEKDTGPVLAADDDARITPLGRFLRTFRIDELPQLLNILAGEMSFVGPRPERGFFVERFARDIPGYRERFRVKPGATGLAQVSGSYATTPERKLKYDLIYMYHQNLLMDVQILVETLRVVLTGRGAR
ncbi:MAG: sugar transferase [Actinobacteria bacterium]|nr:MAG: sugar transferase [Actinomycetota bacterium]